MGEEADRWAPGGDLWAKAEEQKPLMAWDDTQLHDRVIWMSRLDNRYQIEVDRIDGSLGRFRMFDHADGDRLVHEQQVSLAYEALFGPDVSDVSAWQEIAMSVADAEGSP